MYYVLQVFRYFILAMVQWLPVHYRVRFEGWSDSQGLIRLVHKVCTWWKIQRYFFSRFEHTIILRHRAHYNTIGTEVYGHCVFFRKEIKPSTCTICLSILCPICVYRVWRSKIKKLWLYGHFKLKISTWLLFLLITMILM